MIATRPRVLVLARNYPNRVLPQLGLWTQRLVQCAASVADVKVISPVPYAPPLPNWGSLRHYTRFRDVERHTWDGSVEVWHPRMVVGPSYSLHNVEALTYAAATLPLASRLRRSFPFDLIHAHFGYPDGVVGCALGRRYGVPVVLTEHAPWLPWLGKYPWVRRQARWAASSCSAHLAVSHSVEQSILQVTGDPGRLRVVPNVVDGSVFQPRSDTVRNADQVLFVGAVRHTKGVDVLLHALAAIRRRRLCVRLVMVGVPFYAAYRRDAERLEQLARELGIADCVETVGGKAPREVAELMGRSAVVVLPSRAESFGAVLIEALACGTPVVSTRSGGPEEIVTPEAGQLVPTEDAPALAEAIERVLEHPERYPPARLRDYALRRFGVPVVTQQLAAVYRAVLEQQAKADPQLVPSYSPSRMQGETP